MCGEPSFYSLCKLTTGRELKKHGMFSINAENIAFLCYSGERICSISKSESITARCDPTCSEASCSLNATKVQYLDLSYTNTFLTAVLHIMEFLSCFDTSATDWSALGATLCGTFGGLLLLLSSLRGCPPSS